MATVFLFPHLVGPVFAGASEAHGRAAPAHVPQSGLSNMKEVAVVVLLMASVHLSSPNCDAAGNISFCTEIPSVFQPGIEILIMRVKNVGQLNSSVLHSDSLTSVTTLRMNNAGVTGVDQGAFSSFLSLQTVHLEQNSLTEVNPKWFGRPSIVRQLSLPHNKIEGLNQSSLLGLSALSILNLSNNHIEDIHPDTFSLQSHLKELDLSHNKLTRLATRVFSPLPSTKIRLDGNPWDCSCEAQDFVYFLQGARNRSLLAHEMEVTCESPPALRGQVMWNASLCAAPPPTSPTPTPRPDLASTRATTAAGVTHPASHTPPAETSVSSKTTGPQTAAGRTNTHHTFPPGTKTSINSKPTSPPAATSTAVTADPTQSDLPSVFPSSTSESSLPTNPPSDPNIIRTLIAAIVVLSLLLLAMCLLTVLQCRKRKSKTVVPGPQQDEETEVKGELGPVYVVPLDKHSPGEWETAWMRPFAGERAKSANAVLLQAPFCSPGRHNAASEGESKASAEDEEQSEGSQVENGAIKNEAEVGKSADGDTCCDSVCSGASPYLSIGTNQNKPQAQDLDGRHDEGLGLRSRMGRISTWPPTAVQWRARRSAMEQGEENIVEFANLPLNAVFKFAGDASLGKKEEAGDTEAPTQTANEVSETASGRKSPLSEAWNHSDPSQDESSKEKEGTCATKALYSNPKKQKTNLKALETPSHRRPRKGSSRGAPRNERRSGGSRENRGASSKAPSGGASPDDETLLCGNQYAFMDLLHEVVQHNGRWTRERWKQAHVGKQRHSQHGPR